MKAFLTLFLSMKSIKSNKKIALLCILVTFLSYGQESQSLDALITDRPDATEASSTVEKGFLQVETGAFF